MEAIQVGVLCYLAAADSLHRTSLVVRPLSAVYMASTHRNYLILQYLLGRRWHAVHSSIGYLLAPC